jgi:glucokinase-like ROK family protein
MRSTGTDRISDHERMKLNNQLIVLKRVRDRGPISRVDLQQSTKLSWGTITSSIKELLERQILVEIGSVKTGIGRRPVELDLNTEENRVLGLHLGGIQVRSVLVDVRGGVIDALDLPVDPDGSSREILACLIRTARQMLRRHSMEAAALAGIGIAAPGAVDFHRGVCLYAPHHPKWKDVPLKKKFQTAFGVPCFVDHVSNCFALSEKLFGQGQGLDNFICVLLGTGVSAGIVIAGEVYRGADCFSGEFGHTCIDLDGPLCACGNNGCIEAYASGPALACAASEEAAREPGSLLHQLSGGDASRITGETLALAAGKGDPLALRTFQRMGVFLGVGVSNLINVFNPQCIILGGAVSRASEHFLDSLQDTIRKRAWHASTKDIAVSRLERGAERGAAALVLQEILATGQILRGRRERGGNGRA